MEKLLKIPYNVFNSWNQLQQFLERKDNPRYELVGNVDLCKREDIFDLGNLVRVYGDLLLFDTPIKFLGNLEYVDGYLDLRFTPIKSLGKVKYVGDKLNLRRVLIQSLGNLEYVGGDLDLRDTPIQSLGNLEYVGKEIWLLDDHQIPQEELNKFNYTIW